MQDNNNFYWLASRTLAGEATEQEQRQLQELLSEDASLHTCYQQLITFWNQQPPAIKEKAAIAFEKVWARIEK